MTTSQADSGTEPSVRDGGRYGPSHHLGVPQAMVGPTALLPALSGPVHALEHLGAGEEDTVQSSPGSCRCPG